MNTERNPAERQRVRGGWDRRLRVLTAAELMTMEFPSVEWLVADLIPAGALALLVGRPKVGKSLMAIDLLASVARGEPFLGRSTATGTALYVPAEDDLELVRDRIRTRIGDTWDLPLCVIPADGSLDQAIRLDIPPSLARLGATIKAMRPKVVVLDPFRELHHQSENEAEVMAGLLRPLRQLAHSTRSAIVLIHHRNKYASDPSLATRGSSAISGGVDLTITIASRDADPGEDPEQTLELRVEGRYGPRQRAGARLTEGLRWAPAAASDSGGPLIPERLLSYLRGNPARPTAAEIATELGLGATTVRNALAELERAGKVFRSGQGTRADPFRYRAAAPETGNGPAVMQTRLER